MCNRSPCSFPESWRSSRRLLMRELGHGLQATPANDSPADLTLKHPIRARVLYRRKVTLRIVHVPLSRPRLHRRWNLNRGHASPPLVCSRRVSALRSPAPPTSGSCVRLTSIAPPIGQFAKHIEIRFYSGSARETRTTKSQATSSKTRVCRSPHVPKLLFYSPILPSLLCTDGRPCLYGRRWRRALKAATVCALLQLRLLRVAGTCCTLALESQAHLEM